MENLINKISTFNIFNYLVPGMVFVFLVSKTTRFNLQMGQENYVILLPFFYLCGLILSSISSLSRNLLAYLKNFRVDLQNFAGIKQGNPSPVKQAGISARYRDYLLAKKLDPEIEVLAEVRAMTRTFAVMFFILAFIAILDKAIVYFDAQSSPFFPWALPSGLLLFGMILWISHNKTDNFIEDRKKFALDQTRLDALG